MKEKDILKELRMFDTPSITNVVATYPGNPLCLELYNPWTENWYTDKNIKCMFPEIGPIAGYAVTCVYGIPDPGYSKYSFMDVIDVLDSSKKPTILVIQQKFPHEIKDKVGLAGGNMAISMKAVGCLGLVSDGPSRDIAEVRGMEFQFLITGVTPGHGPMVIQAINVPVSVSGMDVAPGEIIHMDENGACKFPEWALEDVLKNVKRLVSGEQKKFEDMKKARNAAQVREIYQRYKTQKHY